MAARPPAGHRAKRSRARRRGTVSWLRPRPPTPPSSIRRCRRPATTNCVLTTRAAGRLGRDAAGSRRVRLRHRNRCAGPDARQPGRHQPGGGAGQGLPTSRWRMTIPARRRSCRATRCWTRCGRCWPTPASASSASTASTTCTCCAGMASTWPGYADDTMLESFVLNAGAARHDMDSLAHALPGLHRPSSSRTWPARAPSRSCSRRSRWTTRPATPPKTPTSPCACIACCSRSSRPMPALDCGLPRHRDAAGAGAGADRSQRRADRRRRTAPAVGRPVASACWPRSRRPPNWPGAPSTWIRPSSWGRCCSTN